MGTERGAAWFTGWLAPDAGAARMASALDRLSSSW